MGHGLCWYSDSKPPDYEYGDINKLNINEEQLQILIKKAEDTDSQALLIVKHDKLIVEKYWRLESSFEFPLQSITKSLTSLAIGCLIDEGKLSLDDRANKWFKEWSGEKSKITIRHLLTHTSGIQENADVMEKSKNQLQFAMDQPITTVPGENYYFSEAGVFLLGEIVKRVSGVPVDEYLERKIFKPLNITHWSWKKDSAGNVIGNGGAAMTARELLKIGTLLLQKGKWQGESLISENYLEMALQASEKKDTYGFLFVLFSRGYYAAGKFGQFLLMIPKHDTIVVRLRTPVGKGEQNFSNKHWETLPKETRDLFKKTSDSDKPKKPEKSSSSSEN